MEPLLLESALVRPVKHQSTKVSNNVQTRFQQTGKMCARLKKYGTELPTKLQTAMISLEKRQGRVNVHVASVYLLSSCWEDAVENPVLSQERLDKLCAKPQAWSNQCGGDVRSCARRARSRMR